MSRACVAWRRPSTVTGDEADADVADLASRLGLTYAFMGDLERSTEMTELALSVSRPLRLPEPLSRALATKAMLARLLGRPEEELAFHRHAIRYTLENDLPTHRLSTAYGNLSDACLGGTGTGRHWRPSVTLALARRGGDRGSELYILTETTYALYDDRPLGRGLEIFRELPRRDRRHERQLRERPHRRSRDLRPPRPARTGGRGAVDVRVPRRGESALQDRAEFALRRPTSYSPEGPRGEAVAAGSEAAGVTAVNVAQVPKEGVVAWSRHLSGAVT